MVFDPELRGQCRLLHLQACFGLVSLLKYDFCSTKVPRKSFLFADELESEPSSESSESSRVECVSRGGAFFSGR